MRKKVDPTRDHNAFRGGGAFGRPHAVLADVCRALALRGEADKNIIADHVIHMARGAGLDATPTPEAIVKAVDDHLRWALVENRSPLVTPDGPRWRLSDAGEALFRRRDFDARRSVRRLSA